MNVEVIMVRYFIIGYSAFGVRYYQKQNPGKRAMAICTLRRRKEYSLKVYGKFWQVFLSLVFRSCLGVIEPVLIYALFCDVKFRSMGAAGVRVADRTRTEKFIYYPQ